MPAPPLDQRYLVLAEGKDDQLFLGALLREMGLNDVIVRGYECKDRLREHLSVLLKDPGFERHVKAYAIIRDSDADCKASFQSVLSSLKVLGEPIPDKPGQFKVSDHHAVGVYLLPSCLENGCLEDLCLRTVERSPVMKCVNDFMSCLKKQCQQKPKDGLCQSGMAYYPRNEAKAKAHAFLAGQEDLHQEIGRAAQGGDWDLNHGALAALREFLAAMRKH